VKRKQFGWLGREDSNPYKQIQNLPSYPWTTPHPELILYHNSGSFVNRSNDPGNSGPLQTISFERGILFALAQIVYNGNFLEEELYRSGQLDWTPFFRVFL
jgi:hypothetical protein